VNARRGVVRNGIKDLMNVRIPHPFYG